MCIRDSKGKDSKVAKKGRLRKIVELCTFTMGCTYAALASTTGNWEAMAPISIEHGYDLYTKDGRDRAEHDIRIGKPDLIVAQWMCGPHSNLQHVNIAKGGLTADKIMEDRRKYTGLIDWIENIENGRGQSIKDNG